jgi:nucleoside 2-deoxyribosyltransferase
MIKIYLAGPDVFRQNAMEHFNTLKVTCDKHGFEGIAPLDNTINVNPEDELTPVHSNLIFTANVDMIKNCDVIVANIEPFRGAGVDDGTAWEIAYGFALGKKIWGYSDYCNLALKAITNVMFDINRQEHYPIVENFGNTANLMIVESIKKSGGGIFKTFEECIENVYKVYNVDELKTLAVDTDFIDYLIVKKLKNIVVKSQDYEKAAILRDREKMLDEKLINKYDNKTVPEYNDTRSIFKILNLNIYDGIECHPIFNSTENYRRYALQLFELNIAETTYYKKEKDTVIAILRERQITEILE